MQNKKAALLLDFDGVVLRNHPAHRAVSLKCQRMMSHFINIKSPAKLQEINNALYQTTGHTVIGLNRLGFKVSPQAFNKVVYDTFDYTAFKNIGQTHKRDIDDLCKLADFCSPNDIYLGIFSNAPDTWCKTILQAMSAQLSEIPTMSCVTDNNLKPLDDTYDIIEKNILNKFSKFTFVDDKILNLLPVMENQKWTKIWLSESKQDTVYNIRGCQLHVIGCDSQLHKSIPFILQSESMSDVGNRNEHTGLFH